MIFFSLHKTHEFINDCVKPVTEIKLLEKLTGLSELDWGIREVGRLDGDDKAPI